MNATPSFGVSMISEVPSNPQLTLNTQNIFTKKLKVDNLLIVLSTLNHESGIPV